MAKLKDVYNKIKEEKENTIKGDSVSMKIEDFVEEHKCLIKILREGSREELLAEAEEQEEELEKVMEELGIKEDEEED